MRHFVKLEYLHWLFIIDDMYCMKFKHIDYDNVMSRSTTDGLLTNWQYLL